MTESEKQDFLRISTTQPEHHYEALGLMPFSEYKIENYNDRKEYANTEITDSVIKNNALKYINSARAFLTLPQKKRQYDSELKPLLERKIIKFIEFAVLKDKILDNDERQQVEETGKSYGFSVNEIHELIETQRKKLKFTDSSGSKEKEAASTTTKAGSPKLEIHNNAYFLKNKEFIFDNVKLSETRRELITIKNGGGGTLDAEAKFTAKWIQVLPNKIHQSKLPQDVTIIIDPSKDKSLKNGSGVMETINLTYASSSGTINVPIVVKMAIEGNRELRNRQTKYTTLVSAVLAAFILFYLFSTYNFSGWVIFGFVVSAIAIGLGVSKAIQNKNDFVVLLIGGIILIITNFTVFFLVLTVIFTFFTAKILFKKYPFQNQLIAFIPIGYSVLFLSFLFFGMGSLPYSSKSYNNNNSQITSSPTVPQNTNTANTSINCTGNITAEVYANIRSGTSTDFGVVATINRGETIHVIEQDRKTGWYKVRNGSIYGYISDKLVSLDNVPNNNSKETTESKRIEINPTLKIDKKLINGSWNIANENSSYFFNSFGLGEYRNSRGKSTHFQWYLNGNELKLVMDNDNQIWQWEIKSFSSNRIELYNSSQNIQRIITK